MRLAGTTELWNGSSLSFRVGGLLKSCLVAAREIKSAG